MNVIRRVLATPVGTCCRPAAMPRPDNGLIHGICEEG